jgi:hypothetical protein
VLAHFVWNESSRVSDNRLHCVNPGGDPRRGIGSLRILVHPSNRRRGAGRQGQSMVPELPLEPRHGCRHLQDSAGI